MTEKKNNVTSITKKKQKEIKEQMQSEDEYIQEQMKRDQEEINKQLRMYASVMPKIDHSSVTEEEDEDEEEFIIDPANGVVTQIVEEGILLKEDGVTIQGELISIQGSLGLPYGDFIRDIIVRKAIASLLKRTRDEWSDVSTMQEKMPSYLAESLTEAVKGLDKKRMELAKAIRGNEVHYADIPEWAQPFIEQHIEKIMTNLITMGEEW